MRRYAPVLIAIALAIALATPATALAGKAVALKNASGVKMGAARQTSSKQGTVFNRKGVRY